MAVPFSDLRTSELLLEIARAIESFDDDLHCSGYVDALRARAALLRRAVETLGELRRTDPELDDLTKVATGILQSIGELPPTT
jgi:hypothetical protein